MQPPLRRALGNAELNREIRDGNPMQVMHHKEMPVVNAEPIERAVQGGHVGRSACRVLAPEVLRAIEADLARTPPAPEHSRQRFTIILFNHASNLVRSRSLGR